MRYRTQHITPLRYVAVGEYGSETWRPHYHLVLFGHGLEIEPVVNDAWSEKSGEQTGFSQVSEMTFDRAMYIAHYTVKKITQQGDPHLKGRLPEFSRWSKGMGLPAISWLADTMGKSIKYPEDSLTTDGPQFGEYGPMLRLIGDVFNTVRIEGRILPLGLYMRRKLRESLGLSQNARERAIQLGRFNHDTGEIYEQELPKEYCPTADLSDVRTPWRIEAEAKKRRAQQIEVDKRAAKSDRQASLSLTEGNRI
ncbi:replication initiator protein [Microviridae sp.]|nr:replication initiator protein [Microviridae sp.]